MLVAFALRFVCGGLVIAIVPTIASRFGGFWAGVVASVPALTLVAFVVLGIEGGLPAVSSAARGAMVEAPAVVGYLITVYTVSRTSSSISLVLGCGVLAWLALTLVMFAVARFLAIGSA